MISPDLLKLLACPESRQPLAAADLGLLQRVNRAIAVGHLRTKGGQTVTQPLTEALVRQDGAVVYPIEDGIPVMLIDRAISLEGLPA